MKKTNNNRLMPGLLFLAALLIVAFAVYWTYQQAILAPISPGSTKKVAVIVKRGASLRSIGSILVKNGLIRSAAAFELAIGDSGYRSNMQPGYYELSPSQSAAQIVSTLELGHAVTVLVTIPEGFTLEQIAQRLDAHGIVSRADFASRALHDGRSFATSEGFSPPDDNLEGYLFPATYRFSPQSSAVDVIETMLEAFVTHVVEPNPQVSDWRPVVNLASLVEREAQQDRDRPLIAGVLLHRLHIGMPLQCDATIEYALPIHKTRLYYGDLKIHSPYNTYLHHGLPPTPICNPGLPSIEAALHPAHTPYLFYLAGPGGATTFFKTLAAQHQEIGRERLQRLKEQRIELSVKL